MGAVDYDQLQEDLETFLGAAFVGKNIWTAPDGSIQSINKIGSELMEREMGLDQMPLVNVRLAEAASDVVSIPDSEFETVGFLVDVVAFDFTSYREASRIRTRMLKVIRDAIMGNRRWSGILTTSFVGSKTTFVASTPEGASGHVAFATIEVLAQAYIDVDRS